MLLEKLLERKTIETFKLPGNFRALRDLLRRYLVIFAANLFNDLQMQIFPVERRVPFVTVSSCTGTDTVARDLETRTGGAVESMEGAAFFYACHQLKVPCVQIRAVSNYVEKRNRDNWEIGLAVKNLNTFALELIREL